MNVELIVARARLLCLLRDYDRAKKAHHIPKRLARSLCRQNALVMRLEAAR